VCCVVFCFTHYTQKHKHREWEKGQIVYLFFFPSILFNSATLPSDMDAGYNPRTVEEVFRDFKGRRAALIKALTTGSYFLSFSIPILSFSLRLKNKKLKRIDLFHLPNVFLFHFYVGIPDVEEFYQQCDPGNVLFRTKLFFCCFCFGRFLWCIFSSLVHWIGLISEVESEDYFEFGFCWFQFGEKFEFRWVRNYVWIRFWEVFLRIGTHNNEFQCSTRLRGKMLLSE